VKIVKIFLAAGCGLWAFRFYDSSESAFYMMQYPSLRDDDSYVKRIVLKGNETLEIEWLGSEWVHECNSSERFDKIRVRKFTPIHDSPQWDACVDTTAGWVVGGSLDWNGGTSHDVRIIPLIMGEEYSHDNYRLFVGGTDADGTDDVKLVGDPN
jgi:hypothetical protein